MRKVFLLLLLLGLAIEGRSQGKPAVLRCSFRGGIDLHASRDPASPVLAKVMCGDAVLLVDQRFGSPHLRTEDGKDGFVLSMNLGQWSIEPEASPAANSSVAPQPTTAATSNVAASARPVTPTSPVPFRPPAETPTARVTPGAEPQASSAANSSVAPQPTTAAATTNVAASARPVTPTPAVPFRPPAETPTARVTPGPVRVLFASKIYIAPMSGGLDGYIAAEFVKQNIPVVVVTDETAADFILAGSAQTQDNKWFNTIFGGKDKNEGNVRLLSVADRTLVWAGEAGDRSLWWGNLSRGGERKIADRIVNKMKDDLFKRK
jgi:hypothetical protein